uniref:Multidrug resistance-associated protein 5 n=1 Tax=Tanacetum cinerariifolium TaxID=118510 RepID=A0A6L2NS84_TANCI|nr:multidrug resistance-associated protein 5 [Tanacetum cinerariifolium]
MPDLGDDNGKEIGGEVATNIGETLDNEDVVQKYIKEEVIAKKKTLDKGKENEDLSCGSDSDSESETHQENQMYMSDDSKNEESLKSFDYLSEGEAKLGEKFVNVDQFKECLTYYALANGFSLWYDSDDLDLQTGCGLTLISDQHKGLLEAVKEVMSYAEHRQYARHIYEGFRKQYSEVEFKQLFWASSKAS